MSSRLAALTLLVFVFNLHGTIYGEVDNHGNTGTTVPVSPNPRLGEPSQIVVGARLDSLKTVLGYTYRNVVIGKIDIQKRYILISHSKGMKRLSEATLLPEMRRRLFPSEKQTKVAAEPEKQEDMPLAREATSRAAETRSHIQKEARENLDSPIKKFISEINQVFGVELFKDENLWDDAADRIVSRYASNQNSDADNLTINLLRRIGLSSDFVEEGQRDENGVLMLEGIPEGRYIEQGLPFFKLITEKVILTNTDRGEISKVQIIFYNEDDTAYRIDSMRKSYRQQLRDRYRNDPEIVEGALTDLFGERKRDRDENTNLKAKVWYWKNHSFTLLETRNRMLMLTVQPVDSAEEEHENFAEGKEHAVRTVNYSEKVTRRANGDVIIEAVPMIEQGDKGYCVPATWARVLQYINIPIDEYTLAQRAGSSAEGGTYNRNMVAASRKLLGEKGAKLRRFGKLEFDTIQEIIQQGYPIIWSMRVTEDFRKAHSNPAERMGDLTIKEYKRHARNRGKKGSRDYNHVCLIIGYNDATEEIASSDTWGEGHFEKWNSFEAAKRASQNENFYIIPAGADED